MLLQVKRLEDHNLALRLQLETCTGRPASDWGSIPATPSDLTLPNQASLHLNQKTSLEPNVVRLAARLLQDESDMDVTVVAVKGHCWKWKVGCACALCKMPGCWGQEHVSHDSMLLPCCLP